MSARCAGCFETAMSSSRRLLLGMSLAASRAKDNTGRTVACEGIAAKALGSCGAVLVVLRLDLFARLLPVGVGPVAQLIEIPAHGERLAAIHRNGFAVDPVTAAGNQEHR